MITIEKAPLVIRALHWCVALSFVLNMFVLPAGDGAHRLLGFVMGALVAVRLVLIRFHEVAYLNPRAVFVYLLIGLSILALGVTGGMTQLDFFWGNSDLKQVHAIIAYLLTALVFAHLAGVFIDACRHRRKTWMKMI